MTVHLAHLKLRSEFCITGILCNVTIRYNVTMQQQLDVFFDPFVELFLASGRKMGGKTSKEKRMHQISQVAGGKEFWCAMPVLW